jgi:hypothetical protein
MSILGRFLPPFLAVFASDTDWDGCSVVLSLVEGTSLCFVVSAGLEGTVTTSDLALGRIGVGCCCEVKLTPDFV